MIGVAFAWFFILFSFLSLCWFGSGWFRFYDCQCRHPQRVVILRPNRIPGSDTETGYYVPAATFDDFFSKRFVNASHFENVNETAAAPVTATSTSSDPNKVTNRPQTDPPTYTP